MKKTLSLVLVATMLLSMVALVPFTASAAHTLDENNVGVEAYRFDGNVVYSELYGRGVGNSKYGWLDAVSVKEGNDTSTTLNIDGIIEEGEWGQVSFSVHSDYAASNDGMLSSQNLVYEVPSAENTYFYYDSTKYTEGSNSSPLAVGMGYSVYLMWDEDYFYIAASVSDPDGHKNNMTGADVWDGDCLQFRLDPDGPNSVVGGTGYNAYKVTEEGTPVGEFPWATSTYAGSTETHGAIPNIMVAYSTNESGTDSAQKGTTVVYDAAKRYYEHWADVANPEDPTTTIKELQYTGAYLNYSTLVNEDLKEEYDGVAGGAAPELVNNGAVYATAYNNTKTKTTQYEIAVPWEHISTAEDFLASIGADTELGMTMMVLDMQTKDLGGWGAFLEWGNGINAGRQTLNYQTCGGSNSVVLSGTAYDEHQACDHEFAESTCIAPETCKKCGYERGFVAGHDYNLSNYKLPTTSEDGYATAICAVCGNVAERTLASSGDVTRKYFNHDEGAIDIPARLSTQGYGATWTHLTWTKETESDGTYKWVSTAGSTVYNVDGANANAAKNSLWLAGQTRPQIDDDVSEMVNPYDFSVLDFTTNITGTYLELSGVDKNFTYKADIDLWDIISASDEKHYSSGYHDTVNFWFGKNDIEYCAGFFKITDEDADGNNLATKYYFAIGDSSMYSSKLTSEEFEERAIAIKEVDISTLDMGQGTWNELVFFVDYDANVALLFWDGELMVGEYDYHFAKADGDHDSTAIIRNMNYQFCLTDILVGSASKAAEYVTTSGEFEVPVPETTVTTEDTSSEESSSDETSTDESSSDESSSDETSTDETSSDETSTDETSSDESSSNEETTAPDIDIPVLENFGLVASAVESDGKLTVTYELQNNPGIWSIAMDLAYNTEALELVSVTNGEIFADEDYVAVEAVNGKHRYYANGAEAGDAVYNRTGNGVLVTYEFNIINAGKAYNFELSAGAVIDAAGADVAMEVVDMLPVKDVFTVTIDGVAQTYTAGAEIELNANKVTVREDGLADVFEKWTINGVEVTEATYTVVVDGDITITSSTYIMGDLTGDGKVNALDSAAILKQIKVGEVTVKSDITGDGKVNALDSAALLKIIKGKYNYAV